jgi:hypothetical protein
MITQEQLKQIGHLTQSQTLSEVVVEQLRSSFPGIHFTYCMDDDVVGATPVYRESAFNLYLIDSRNHCLCFTQDMEVASGVVLAEVEED